MDETSRVRCIQGVGDLAADDKSAGRIERTSHRERLVSVPSTKSHREVEATADVAGVVDRHHVWVLERHRKLRLTREAFAEALIQRKLGRHQLQRATVRLSRKS